MSDVSFFPFSSDTNPCIVFLCIFIGRKSKGRVLSPRHRMKTWHRERKNGCEDKKEKGSLLAPRGPCSDRGVAPPKRSQNSEKRHMDDVDLTDLFLCEGKSRPRVHAPRSAEGCPVQDGMSTAHAPVYGLPVEIIVHVLNGLDLSGRPLFDPMWRFAARATCRLWHDILGTPASAEARAMVRAWRCGRVGGRKRRAQCHCAPCTHDGGGGLKHLIATGRLVTATCVVALGARHERRENDVALFDPHLWCASPIPDQDTALCAAMMSSTRESVNQVVHHRLAPLFACDADGRCPALAIERDDTGGWDHQTEYDDGRRLIIDLLAVAARQGRVTLLASLGAFSERVRAMAREAVAALVYYACTADRTDTIVWLLRGIMDAEGTLARDHPLSPLGAPPLADPVAYRVRACSNVWKAIGEYDAADTMAAILDASDRYAEIHLDPRSAKWAPHGDRWQRHAARCGSVRVLQVCRHRGANLDLNAILTEAARYGCGAVVRWALAQNPIAESANRVGIYWEALSLAAAESASVHDQGADMALDLLCDAIRATYATRAEATKAAIAWWRSAHWDRWGDNTRDCASAIRVALRWRDLLVGNLEPGNATGLLRLAMARLDYKTLDDAVSLFAGHRALDGIDLWAMTLEVLDVSGTVMGSYRQDTRLAVFANDLFSRVDQRRAVEMLMFLASVCAHRAQVGSTTRAQWRSACVVEPVGMSHLPSVDTGNWAAVALPVWLDARGLLACPS